VEKILNLPTDVLVQSRKGRSEKMQKKTLKADDAMRSSNSNSPSSWAQNRRQMMDRVEENGEMNEDQNLTQ